ncbi:MAG: hypothetical protein ACO2PO_11965 [Candidatus Calescibacterium sp.]
MSEKGKIFVFGTKAEGIEKFCRLLKQFNLNSDIFIFHICELPEFREKIEVGSSEKFIVLLRNPALRSFEMWKIMLCEGFEWVDDFELALAREQTRFFGAEHRKLYTTIYNFLYWHSSLYSEKILALKRQLGEKKFFEDVLFLVLDEFRNENEFVKTLGSFLNLRENNTKFSLSDLKITKERIPYNSKIQYVLRAIWEESKRKFGFHPVFLKFIMNLNVLFGKKLEHHWLVDFLSFAFRKEVERLSEILKKDLMKIWEM